MSGTAVCPECIEPDPTKLRVDLVLTGRWDGGQERRVCREVVHCSLHGAFWRWADRDEPLSPVPDAGRIQSNE